MRRVSITAALSLLMAGCSGSTPEQAPHAGIRSESASYSSPEQQAQLKAALATANIPYQTEVRNGEEFVVWDSKYSLAARAAMESRLGPEIPAARNASLSGELHGEFERWLKANSVSYFTKVRDGREFIVWSEADDAKVREWLRARLPQPVFARQFIANDAQPDLQKFRRLVSGGVKPASQHLRSPTPAVQNSMRKVQS